jgi:hypothetical protein
VKWTIFARFSWTCWIITLVTNVHCWTSPSPHQTHLDSPWEIHDSSHRKKL